MTQNPATQSATTVVHALAQSGLTDVCISPGSRSTPLTLAFDAHPDVAVHLLLDERSAGFFALGLAIATDRPVAMVCTSGTAAANYFPAIIEAHMSQVPLLVLTSDRPHELRHSGANQTIDQVKMFGDQVLWAVDLALPEAAPPEGTPSVATRNLVATAARAYAIANGLRKGVVHLNFPFRQPLEPDKSAASARPPSAETLIELGRLHPTPAQLNRLAEIVTQHPRGLIVCGPRCPNEVGFVSAVANLANHLGYPILADPTSGLRFQATTSAPIISGYETFLQNDPGWQTPQLVVRFGAMPISKWLNSYLDRVPITHRIHIRENGVWADDSHRTTWSLQANETAVCEALLAAVDVGERRDWPSAVAHTDNTCWQTVQSELASAEFDGGFVADVVALTPAESTLFVGNSLPIRHLDQYGQAQPKALFAYASRGASGIDGNISTALGLHVGRRKKLVAIMGDITFYHDMNGLLQISQGDLQDLVIVLINNNGGGIFSRLPIANHEPPFTKLFTTPHGLDFEPAARMYGLAFARVTERAAFRTTFAQAIAQPHPTLIEVQTDLGRDEAIRKRINQRWQEVAPT